MKTPFQRIRVGGIVLAAVFLVALAGYYYLGGYDFIDALWMVVITISSVGYSEHSNSGPVLQLFTIAVILIGMSAAAYTLGGFIQLTMAGEIDRHLGRRRMSRDIDNLHKHVIICGFGRIGEALTTDLTSQKRPFVIIEKDATQADEAASRGYPCVIGDATEEQKLLSAGLQRATTIFTGLPTDAANVFITLTARELNEGIQIISRAEHPSTERKLRQAGADRVVMPTIIGAHHVERMITRPSTADLMELVAESSFTDLELDEVVVADEGSLVGANVREIEGHKGRRLLVVAVKQSSGNIIFSPDESIAFRADDILMVMGCNDDIQKFPATYAV